MAIPITISQRSVKLSADLNADIRERAENLSQFHNGIVSCHVTVEGPASVEPWEDTPAHIKRLKELYAAMGRAPKGADEEFAQKMRDEERSLVLVTPERFYGSLRQGS